MSSPAENPDQCRNCGASPDPGSPQGLCSTCLTMRMLEDWDFPPEKEETCSDTPSKYQIEAEVARGGMGCVLRVMDHTLGRHVAMKVLRNEGR